MSLLELVVRGTAMYWFLFLLIRFVLRRDVGQIGVADVLLLVVIADAVAHFMEPKPLPLVRHGRLLRSNLRQRFLTEAELIPAPTRGIPLTAIWLARRFLTIRIRAKLCIYRVFQKEVSSCETSFSPHWASSPSNAYSLLSTSNDSAQNVKGRVKRNRAGRVKAVRRSHRSKSLWQTNSHSSNGARHLPRVEGVGATRRLKLRGGTSVWMSRVRHLPRVALPARDFRVDCLVVGSGISGALTAHALIQSGFSVAMIDRRSPLTGSTPASTALLQFEIDTPLIHLQRRIGARAAERAWLRSYGALRDLAGLIQRERIRCDATARPSVYLAGNVLNATDLQREGRARRRAGLPAEYLTRTTLRSSFGFSRSAALVSAGNLAVDPVSLTAALLRSACRSGMRLLAPYELTGLQPGRGRVLAGTRQGLQIDAKHVVLCTGYELPKIVPAEGHSIASTWAIATRPQSRRLWPQQALVWEASDPYLYLRTTADGRIICGGEDAEFVDEQRRDALLPSKAQTLTHKLRKLLLGVDSRAAFRWTGCFGQSDTGLPSIGAIPGYPRCHAVLGFGGNGITFSMLAAQLLRAAIVGRRDADAALFAFDAARSRR